MPFGPSQPDDAPEPPGPPESPESPQHPDAPRPRLSVEEAGQGAERELVLVKNGQRYVFRCAPGEEPSLLARLSEMVRDPNIDLDWFDAAVLSHQVGQRMGSRLQQIRS